MRSWPAGPANRAVQRQPESVERRAETIRLRGLPRSAGAAPQSRRPSARCWQDEYGDRLDENAKTYIRYAVDGALRMKTLVHDLLTYSRVETQGKPLEPTDADDACAEAIENLAVAIEDAGGGRHARSVADGPRRPPQLVRLFQNLIGNAIKYRGEEPPRIQSAPTNRTTIGCSASATTASASIRSTTSGSS